jgi:hypothetical protein
VARLRDADDLLAPAVTATVKALTVAPEDAAAVRLVERYAATIDRAAQIAADLDEIPPEDYDTPKLLATLQAKVEAQTVLETLGPKLLAALEALGATPAARSKLKAGGAPSAPNQLAALRATRR